MQATSVRIYRTLVPGLTNVTNRLRYYSFYCWVVTRWGTDKHADHTQGWRSFIRRAEALYAMASLVADADTSGGMAGREWAEKAESSLAGAEYLDLVVHDDPESDASYLGAKSGNFGQFYVASMLESGLLRESRGVPLIDDNGRTMAAAFAASSGAAADVFVQAVIDGRARVTDLKPFGETMGPGAIPGGSEEMKLLRDFLGGEVGGHRAAARRSSAWLLLDYMRSGNSKFDENRFRETIYSGFLPDGGAYDPAGETAERWRAYEANELCHAAMASLFNGLMLHLEGQFPIGAEPDQLTTAFLGPIAAELGAEAETWRAWVARDAKGRVGEEHELAGLISSCLSKEAEGAKDSAVLAQAVRLLGVLWVRWVDTGNVIDIVKRHAGNSGRSISAVLATLSAEENTPLTDALAKAIHTHVIDGHTVVAGRKLISSGRDTYHFMTANGRISNGKWRPYLYTSPRINNLARFLADAQMHDGQQPTAEGLKFLENHEAA
jgi:hypothetical protein